jgi:hypothetical protein
MLARRLGVAPSTVRRRAARGLIQAIPNPIGPGALYHANGANPTEDTTTPSLHGRNRDNPDSMPARGLHRDDGYVLTVLPSTATQVAQEAGLSEAAALRCLERLERAGLVWRAEKIPPGRNGGRPAQVWRVTGGQ